MLYEVLKHIRNFFPVTREARSGRFEIEEGVITLDFVNPEQYFLIEGSVFNDGVFRYTNDLKLHDEEFYGRIVPLAIPAAVIDLVTEIEKYHEESGAASPFSSESYGGYSYTRAQNASGNAASWKEAFASRLNTWRKI